MPANTDPEAVPVSAPEWFQVRAHPVAMWKMWLALSAGPGRDQLGALLLVPPLLGDEPLPDEVAEFLDAHADQDPTLRWVVLAMSDPRLRPAVVRLTRVADPKVRAAARQALQGIDQEARVPTLAAIAHARNPDQLVALAAHRASAVDDPRPVVPLLIDALEKHRLEGWSRGAAIQLLQAITLRPLGDDPARWRSFWEQHGTEPYRAWLLEATSQTNASYRIDGYAALGAHPPFDAARPRLIEGTQDPSPAVRMAAADALARWGDARAALALVAFLRDPGPEAREAAFESLARLHDTTLGYDPVATPVKRAPAVGRWHEWARRAALAVTASD